MLLSIIVPTYNSANYVEDTLKSILKNDRDDFEVVIVDDGSTDNTVNLIYERFRDKRVKIYQKNHMGPANIKNFAIKQAEGKYITFVDSDDIISQKYASEIFDCIERSLPDLIIFKYYKFNEVIEDSSFVSFGGSNINTMGTMVWNKVYAASLLKNIEFPEGTVFEDVMFSVEALLNAKKVVFLDTSLYFYRQRASSLTKNNNIPPERHLDILKCFNNFFEKNSINDREYTTKRQLSILINTLILDHCKRVVNSNKDRKISRKVVKKLLNYRKVIRKELGKNILDDRISKRVTKFLDLFLLRISAFKVFMIMEYTKSFLKKLIKNN